MDRPVLPVFPAPTEARVEATHRVLMRNIFPSLSRRCREKNFVAGTWMHCTLLSLEKPPEARALEDARLANLDECT